RVAVLEGKPSLGGRAYSFSDEETGDWVDNGQHALMGCYSQTLDFLSRIGSARKLVFHRDLEIEMLERGGKCAMLKTARLPGPFHMAAALMRYQHLTLPERIGAVRGGLRLLWMRRHAHAALARMTVARLMDELGQGSRARECFWNPIAIATLNEDPERSSAALLAEVLKRAFFSRRRDSAFVYSKVGLSELYCAGAAALVERKGGSVVQRSIVEALELDARGNVACARIRDGRRIEARCFIAATPPAQLTRLLPESVVTDPFFARLQRLDSSPIICAHVWLDREVTASPFVGFIGATTQWLFNKRKIFERLGARHPGYLSFVISGARRLVDRPNDELLEIIMNDLRAMIPRARDAKVVHSLVLKEKQATMAPDPESDALRPPVATPLGNFFLAGDWVHTGLPATIESAVVSGRQAASKAQAWLQEQV
ncbi:MAG: hydroxysqualene dehydroxylase HpnE, partial [Candidatus Binataceae bacterium]